MNDRRFDEIRTGFGATLDQLILEGLRSADDFPPNSFSERLPRSDRLLKKRRGKRNSVLRPYRPGVAGAIRRRP